MSENAYYASPEGLASGTRQIGHISRLVTDMVKEFIIDVSFTSGWPGHDDSYAKQVLLLEKEQRLSAVKTGTSLSEVIVGVGDGTLANLLNVLSTQNGAFDAIHESIINTGDTNHGSRGGRI